MLATEDILYVEKSDFEVVPVAKKDIQMLRFVPCPWRDGWWVSVAVYRWNQEYPLIESRLFWISDSRDLDMMSKGAEKLLADFAKESEFFQVKVKIVGDETFYYMMIYGPDVFYVGKNFLHFKRKDSRPDLVRLSPEQLDQVRESWKKWRENERRPV